MLTFKDTYKNGFGKHCEKRRKCWKRAFSPFPGFFYYTKERMVIFATFNLSSANAFNLVISKIWSFGNGFSLNFGRLVEIKGGKLEGKDF